MVRPPKKLQKVYDQVRKEILEGHWAVGDKLPGEPEMAEKFACSPGTVSKALTLLAHEGFVKRRARAGTTVLEGPEEKARTQLDAFAFIYPSEQHEGVWRTVKGFQAAANEAGRRVVMLTTGLDYQKETEFIARLSEFDVRGAVIYPIVPDAQAQVRLSHLLVNSRFPVVLTQLNLPGLGCPSVVIDGFHAGYTMTKHMLHRGAGKIGFFSNFAWAPFMRDRYQGYRWALEEVGIQEPPGGVCLSSAMNPDFQNPLAEPTALAAKFFEEAGKLDAVVCADDFLALGCIAAAQKRGWRVPEDLLVTGIDDCGVSSAPGGIALTTYRISFEEIGRKSFALLQKVVATEAPIPGEDSVRGELIIREST